LRELRHVDGMWKLFPCAEYLDNYVRQKLCEIVDGYIKLNY